MALRLIEVMLPPISIRRLHEALEDQDVMGLWISEPGDNLAVARILVNTEWTESVSDRLSHYLSLHPEFRLMLFTVEATLPRPEEPEAEQAAEDDEPQAERVQRISREELYYDVAQGAELSSIYLLTVVLSTLVAAVGLIRGDVAVIIGAMVIAPLLGPNVALALASTLGDLSLGIRSLKTLLAGVGTALVLALAMGFFGGVDPQAPEIAARTGVDIGHMVLALAAGTAGALAFTSGVPATVIGVMVAVALLPPLVVVGLLAGAGYWGLATGAFLLFITNVACINLAGITTFLVRKVQPRTWWESQRAVRSARIALALWIGTLLLLVAVILLSNPIGT